MSFESEPPRAAPGTPRERYGRAPCPQCGSTGPHRVEAVYADGAELVCGHCAHTWTAGDPPPPAPGRHHFTT